MRLFLGLFLRLLMTDEQQCSLTWVLVQGLCRVRKTWEPLDWVVVTPDGLRGLENCLLADKDLFLKLGQSHVTHHSGWRHCVEPNVPYIEMSNQRISCSPHHCCSSTKSNEHHAGTPLLCSPARIHRSVAGQKSQAINEQRLPVALTVGLAICTFFRPFALSVIAPAMPTRSIPEHR